jgi:hypothetical protein
MALPDDYVARHSSGTPFPESAVAAFRRQSQLDFDVDFYHAVLERDPDYVDVLRCQGELLSRKGLHDRALVVDRRLAELLPGDPVVQYNLACSLALGGFDVESLAALETAFETGYDDFEHLEADKDLDSLRTSSAFQTLLLRYATD